MQVALPSVIIILFISAVAIYNDYKYKKIPNKFIYPIISIALLLHLLYEPKRAILVFVFASILAFLLYMMKVWAPGDAKLFIAFAMILPPVHSNHFLINIFPAILIILYGAIVYLIGDTLLQIRKIKIVKPKLKKGFFPGLFERILFAAACSWPFRIGLAKIINFPDFWSILVVILLHGPLKRCIKGKNSVFYTIIGISLILQLALLNTILITLEYVVYISIFGIVFSLIFQVIPMSMTEILNQKMSIKRLKPYMTINENIYLDKNKTKPLYLKGQRITLENYKNLKYLYPQVYPKQLTVEAYASGAIPLSLGIVLTLLFHDALIRLIIPF